MINKNRLCSKTCGIDNIVKNSKEKNYSEILSELYIMSGNSSGLDLDPTPKRNHRAEVSGRILADCHFLVDPTPKRIYSAEERYSGDMQTAPPPQQQPPQQQQQLSQF